MTRKVNYLNNKDILKEIAKSKLTYCSFVDDSVKSYDIIVTGVDKITKKAIQEARKLRAERLAKELQEQDLLSGVKKKPTESQVLKTMQKAVSTQKRHMIGNVKFFL